MVHIKTAVRILIALKRNMNAVFEKHTINTNKKIDEKIIAENCLNKKSFFHTLYIHCTLFLHSFFFAHIHGIYQLYNNEKIYVNVQRKIIVTFYQCFC